MNSEDLLKLADRCEWEGANFELECDIFQAIGGPAWDLAYERAQEPCGCPHETAVFIARHRAPRFCTSLDAAVALEPADVVEIVVRKYPDRGHYVRITLADGRLVYSEAFHTRTTEPMARCAAALRARAVSCKEPGAMRGEAEPVPVPHSKESA